MRINEKIIVAVIEWKNKLSMVITREKKTDFNYFKEGLFVLFYIAIVTIFSMYFGLKQFGGYDLSPIIDLQHRLENNQIPNVDFICTLPLSIAVILKIWNFITPPKYINLFWINCVLYAICSSIIFIYWPAYISNFKKFFTIFLISLPSFVTNHIWHSSISQIFAVVYCVLALSFFQDRKAHEKYIRNCIFVIVTGFLFFSKQNLGFPLVGLTCFISCIFIFINYRNDRLRKKVFSFIFLNIIGVIGIVILIMFFLRMNLSSVAHTFYDVLGRAKILDGQFDTLTIVRWCIEIFLYAILILICKNRLKNTSRNIYAIFAYVFFSIILLIQYATFSDTLIYLIIVMIAFITLCLLGEFKIERAKKIDFIITGSALFCSLIPLLTDWDLKWNNAPLFLFSLFILTNTDSRLLKKIFCILAFFLLFFACWSGVMRERMRDIGIGMFWEDLPLIKVPSGYFSGLYASPRFIGVTYELDRLKEKKLIRDNQRVFCGPRMEFCYADLNIKSPKDLPLWWHPGTSYPIASEEKIIRGFINNHFDMLIFLPNDRTRMPQTILQYIDKNYERTNEYMYIEVYHKKIFDGNYIIGM